MEKRYILIDDEDLTDLKKNLSENGYQLIDHLLHPDGGLDRISASNPDFLILDALFGGKSLGADFCKKVCKKYPSLPVAIHTENISNDKLEDIKNYYDLENLENVSILPKSLSRDGFLGHLATFLDKMNNGSNYIEDKSEDFGFVVGSTPAMQNVIQTIKEAASNDSLETLIMGESGTGKELVAKAIHNLSSRNGNLVSRNITEIASNLIESELFGHVKGAFTGAEQDFSGIFEQAEGGTIFLDEIGDLDLKNQAKLLRVLQEKEVIRVGSSKRIPLNIKVITATKHNLKKLVEEGKFREDLYYRSLGFQIKLPPLRARKQDIPELCRHFIEQENKRQDYEIDLELPVSELERLKSYSWPGNIRQLEKVIQKAHTTAKVKGRKFITSFELEEETITELVSIEQWVEKIYDLDTYTPWEEVEANVPKSQRHDLLMGVIRKLRDEIGGFPRKEIAKRIDRTDNMTGQVLKKYQINLKILRNQPDF